MPDVTIEVDATQASAFVRAVWSDQLPFAESAAINQSALGGQRIQREHQRRIFEVRRPQFVDRAVKIAQFASKRQEIREARMRVEPVGASRGRQLDPGNRRADILAKFETETLKRPKKADALWVPTDAVTVDGTVMKGWRPRELKFQSWGQGSKARVRRGRRRTFMILYGRAKEGGLSREGLASGLIFERDGDRLDLLYTRHGSVPIEPELKFRENITRHVLDNWDANFAQAFGRAMRTAR